MSRMSVLACLLALAPLGCAGQRAEMFAATGDKSQPQAALPAGGIARYLAHGSDAALKARRDDAVGLMKAYCSGPYKIVTEGPYRVIDVGTVIPAGEGGFTVQSPEKDYWMIVFSCRASAPRSGAAPLP